ncbi:MAG: GrpB family protein [Chloroflexota bacterium]
MIVIQPYNPAWTQEFESMRAALQDVLGARAMRIDHIGSTSVPGLGAKDVIDIQVTVQELSPKIIQKMVNAGYEHSGKNSHDHVPLGEDANPNLWEKLFFNQPQGQRRAHIHVRIDGNPNQRYPLLFRDYLRAHPNSARSIELIKREIAKRHADDVDAYYDIKDPVYDLIWDAAQEWAEHTNWDPNK